MKRSRSFRLAHLIGVLIASGLLCVIAWLLLGRGAENSEKSVINPHDTKSARTDVDNPSAFPPVDKVDRRIKKVDPVVRRFISLYYARNERMTENSISELLKPFVTGRFMRLYSPDLLREGDPWFRTNRAEVKASGALLPGDYHTFSDTLTVKAVVSQIQDSTETSTTKSYTFSVTIELLWSDGWRVNSFL